MTDTVPSAHPAVYAPQADTWLLGDVLDDVLAARSAPCRVLEIGTGSGALAARAVGRPGTGVTAVDIADESLLAAELTALRHGVAVRLLSGDLSAPVVGESFDVIFANPPYVPAPRSTPPVRGPARAWDAGRDGRAVLDRLCVDVPPMLARDGEFPVVQSEFSDIGLTCRRLEEHGLKTTVAARREHAFEPVLSARTTYLETLGLLEAGRRIETLAVIHARRR